MWDGVSGLRRCRSAVTRRETNGWTLEDIYHRYGRRLLADPDVALRAGAYVASLEYGIWERRRPGRRASAYLAGYANGALHTMFEPDAEPDESGHTEAAIRLAAACRLALALGMVKP